MKIFEKSKWIWKKGEIKPDSYAEFVTEFHTDCEKNTVLNIAYDSLVNVFVNGELVLSRQCSDYPYYKMYDAIDITKFCKKDNELRIFVWYFGCDSAVYYNDIPGLIFEVREGEEILAFSSSETKSREDSRYKNGYKKLITGQLGFSFFFDATKENNFPFENSICVEKSEALVKYPVKYCSIEPTVEASLCGKTENSLIFDIGYEEGGFFSIDIDSEGEQTVLVAYGEHLRGGRVPRIIETRDFSFEIRLKKGRTRYTNTMRRIAGRYIELFFEKPVNSAVAGIKPVVYPLNEKKKSFGDELSDMIYSTAVRTLRLCMHEHYEDCPWREQALYALDSRNQMLCGYYAFGEYDFARHNIILMSKGLKDNGLLELTYPAKNTPAIPFFSLAYLTAVREYTEYSGDKSILAEVGDTIDSIINTFSKSITENGLIANLPYPFWNFYEWAEGSANESEITRTADEPYIEQFDLILNCAYIMALENYEKLYGKKTDLAHLRTEVNKAFYDEKKGLYRQTLGRDIYTELGNSLAILSGVAEGARKKAVLNALVGENDMVKITLSMMCFKYDALLCAGREYSGYVLSDIKKNYGYMLKKGATSFWETIDGAEAFDGAGSLCHGWSAMPVYYLSVLKNVN